MSEPTERERMAVAIGDEIARFAAAGVAPDDWATKLADVALAALARAPAAPADAPLGDPPPAAPGGGPDTEIVGWVVWDRVCGTAFRGHIYHSEEQAKAALAGMVWHNRERHEVRLLALVKGEKHG